MDRDKEYYLHKLQLLLATYDYDLNQIFADLTEATYEELLYSLYENGYLDFKDVQLELDF